MKTLEIVVAPDGGVRIATVGFSGAGCRDASRFLEAALGRVAAETLTSEFHEVRAPATDTARQTTAGPGGGG